MRTRERVISTTKVPFMCDGNIAGIVGMGRDNNQTKECEE
jgi:hypothetical protein